MRYSVEMAELASDRLVTLLAEVSKSEPDGVRVESACASGLCDAWTIVDAVNRLRALTYAIPDGEEADYVREFREQTEQIRKLRNDVQHLYARVDKLASDQQPTWGTIAWVTVDQLPIS